MKRILHLGITLFAITLFTSWPLAENNEQNVVAKIRELGFQRSQVVDLVSYMTDVLGARLTLSQDMKRAQAWAQHKMQEIGLSNVTIEPFMLVN